MGWRSTFREFAHAAPGRRFRDFHCRRREGRPQRWVRGLYIGGGLLLIALGFVLGFAPGLPGIVLAVIGTALIVAQSLRAARWMDQVELAGRRWWVAARQRFRA